LLRSEISCNSNPDVAAMLDNLKFITQRPQGDTM
jgi:hypothetical protein